MFSADLLVGFTLLSLLQNAYNPLFSKSFLFHWTLKANSFLAFFYVRFSGGLTTELKVHVVKSINSYNEARPHASCDFLTPNQAHKGSGILAKRWKNNYIKKSLDELEFQELAGEKA